MPNGNNNTAVAKLAKYGLAGVCIALVILIGYMFNIYSTTTNNHSKHQIEAWNKNTAALIKLETTIDKSIEAQTSQAKAFDSFNTTMQLFWQSL